MKFSADIVRGSLYMVAAAFFFSCMSALIRLGSEELHAFQIAFFRNLFGLLFMVPWLLRTGRTALHTERIGLYWLRAILGVMTMLAFFWTLTILPLAEAVSLSFTAPLFVTVGAALILREQVRMRRWSATLVGFLGTLIILRPGFESITAPAIVALLAAATMAMSVLIIKSLSRTESSNAIVTYMVLMMTPLSLLPALFVWEWPDASTWFLMVALGGCGTAGHLLFTRAMSTADASLVMPLDFVRLPIVAALGYLIFDQTV
ncbi:MAG: DMT family transporter, partial [Xanthomonadales bacterium]|nr:DMT family transporter [Xanthomonadales bacterium]